MSNYWVATDKIPVEQKSVRIPAENGTDYIAGQEIRLRLDPTLKFFNPEETYLEFKVKVNPPTYSASGIDSLPCPTRLTLDAETGGQCLVRSLRIHDNNGVLLEEIENYNALVALKYDYHANESLRNKRAMTEGTSKYMIETRGTNGTIKSLANNWYNSPYSKRFTSDPISASFTTNDFTNAKICMPLHSGILSSDKIFPNMLLGGITITLLLEDNNRVFRQNDGVMRFRKLPLNPQFLDATNTDRVNASVKTNGSFDSIRLYQSNAISGVASQCPFVVGEKIGFQRYGNGNASIVEFVETATRKDPIIKTIETDGERIKLTFNQTCVVDGKGMSSEDQDIFLFSKSVEGATNYDPTYTVSDVNLIVQQVMPPSSYESTMMRKMKEGGTINYDFNSFTTYKYSQLSTDRVANIRLPINNSRCKSILCVPTDATVYTSKDNMNASTTYQSDKYDVNNLTVNPDFILRSNRSGLVGIVDEVSSYQWLYDGRLQPNRQVSLTKTATTKSIDAQHLIELDKALSQAGITGHSMSEFNKNFVIGRALALGDAVYDARNKDFSLQVNYENTDAPSKNKLWLSFVAHIRRIQISGNSVSVIV